MSVCQNNGVEDVAHLLSIHHSCWESDYPFGPFTSWNFLFNHAQVSQALLPASSYPEPCSQIDRAHGIGILGHHCLFAGLWSHMTQTTLQCKTASKCLAAS